MSDGNGGMMTTATGLPTIEIYSTLSRAKTPLVTVKPGHVGMYL